MVHECKHEGVRLLNWWFDCHSVVWLETGHIRGRGLQNGRGGGHVNLFYPYNKGGGKVLAMLKGEHKKFLGSFTTVA